MADLVTRDVFKMPREDFERQYRAFRRRWLAERSSVAKTLASMEIGETKEIGWRDLSTHRKRMARDLLGSKDANWQARYTPKCSYVTRIK